MEEPNKTQKTSMSKKYIFLTFSLASALLFSVGTFIPFGMLLILFCPTPLALLGARESRKLMLWGIFLASASLMLLSVWYSVYFFMGYGLLCLGLTLPLGKLKSGSESLFFCILVSILSKIVFFVVILALTGKNPLIPEPEVFRQIVAQMNLEVLTKGGKDAGIFKESIEQMISFVPYMLPSLILMSSSLDSFLNYKMCEFFQRKQPRAFPPLPPFGEWRFPKSLFWPLLLAFLVPLLAQESKDSFWIMLEYNLKLIVNIFFFLQGLSFVWWWLAKRKIALFLRVLIASILSLPILGMWVVAIGLGDICLDFRIREKKRK